MTIPANIERRIKQHVKGKEHSFYAVYPPGFEETALREIEAVFPGKAFAAEKGGIAFDGRVSDCYTANLLLRGAVRVVMRAGIFRALFFEKLYEKVNTIPWELYLSPDRTVSFNVSCRHSKLYHTGRIEEECAKAVAARMLSAYESYSPRETPQQEIFIRFSDDICTVSVDSSGDALYMRGWRTHVSEAPLRENIAALILQEAKAGSYDTIIDPMCGSGSFAVEAALLAGAGDVVHPERRFAFEHWPVFSEPAFGHLKRELSALRMKREISVYASDIDEKAVRAASFNLSSLQADADSPVKIHCAAADFLSLSRGNFTGGRILIVMNPPYGKRLGDGDETERFYSAIGRHIEAQFPDAGFAVIVPGLPAEKAFALKWDRKIVFNNGGIPVAVLVRDGIAPA